MPTSRFAAVDSNPALVHHAQPTSPAHVSSLLLASSPIGGGMGSKRSLFRTRDDRQGVVTKDVLGPHTYVMAVKLLMYSHPPPPSSFANHAGCAGQTTLRGTMFAWIY